MKKKIGYIGVLLAGLLLGWLLFGNSEQSNLEAEHPHKDLTKSTMWTCSMHPQIMQSEPGDCPICGMDLIPAVKNDNGLLAGEFKLSKNAVELANIQTTIVDTGSFKNSDVIALSGKIVENEEESSVQVSYLSGRIEALHINFTGETIKKGQLLATLYAPELYAAQQELITAAALKELQPELYKAVRNKLKLWKLSDYQINQIEQTGKVKENIPIYATVSGTVLKKMVNQGDYIQQGQPMFSIANLNNVWASFDVYENQINLFKKGQEVLIITSAFPNKHFKGNVDFIDPVLNTQTRTVALRVVIKNNKQLFKPGMFVTAAIKETHKNNKLITIPASAVLWTGKRSVVYLKTNAKEPVFKMKEVVLGNQIGNMYQIIDGLSVGDKIVVNGTFTVDAAAQLQGKKSMMNLEQTNFKDGVTLNSQFKLSKDIQQILSKSIFPYLKMKDAFVDNNSQNSSDFAKNTLEQITLISNSDLDETEKTSLEKVKRMLVAIAKNDDLEIQRNHFVVLNEYLIPMIKSMDEIEQQLYIQTCPMAANNNGAFWLSSTKEIRNPYYGAKMRTCGEIKQIID